MSKKVNFSLKPVWDKIVFTLKKWLYEEWELEIYFTGKKTITGDGLVVEETDSKIYHIKKIKKMTPKHMIFVKTDGLLCEIKVTNPMDYRLTKVL